MHNGPNVTWISLVLGNLQLWSALVLGCSILRVHDMGLAAQGCFYLWKVSAGFWIVSKGL